MINIFYVISAKFLLFLDQKNYPIYVTESWDRACLILLSVLVDKVQALILSFFLLNLKFPVKEGEENCFNCYTVKWFWIGDLCMCLYYCVYTPKMMFFPPFFLSFTKVAASLLLCLSNWFPNCMQNDVTSQWRSWDAGL